MPSTCQELAPIVALMPVEEFRRLGAIPTYFDPSSRRLKIICNTALDESSRSEISSRLPDIDIEWHLADEKVFDFMYQRIASEFPAPAEPQESTIPENPADSDDNGPGKTEEPPGENEVDVGEIESQKDGNVEDAEEAEESPDRNSEGVGDTEEPTDGNSEGSYDTEESIDGNKRDTGETKESTDDNNAGADDTGEPIETENSVTLMPEETPEPSHDSTMPPGQQTVLFITAKEGIAQHLVFALNAERFTAVTVKNLDQAIAKLERQPAACVFINENLHGQKEQFIQRIQAARPGTPIRYYRSEASLLMNDTRNPLAYDLLRQNLTLFSRLNDSQGSATADHAATVARFADRMATRRGIPDDSRLMIMTAAFLHNMAEKNLVSTEGLQQTDMIGLSASRLESWDFPQPVTHILRRMYRPVDASEPLDGVEVMAGQILTTADMFCHLWPDRSSSGYQTDLVQRKLENELRGKVPPSVIGTLVEIIGDDSTAQLLRPNEFSVHMYVSEGSQPTELAAGLKDAAFGVTFSSTIENCIHRCHDEKTDVLIIRDSGSVQDVYDTLMSLAMHGLALNELHIMLLLDEKVATDALRLLSHGVEEILPVTAQAQAVITKLTRIKNRIDEEYRHRVSLTERLGTHGSLGDMGLTDILESSRGNRRPTRISVTAFGNQLTVYLDRGRIIAADCGELNGTAALLKGVSWRKGIWNIESIDGSELPEPNIDQTIDAVLIEACSRLDEAGKDEPIYDLLSTPD
jgi:hypothetical protein